MIPDLRTVTWRKSSHSGGNGGECVEVAFASPMVAVRDSKNPRGAALVFSADGVNRFLSAAKRNRFAG